MPPQHVQMLEAFATERADQGTAVLAPYQPACVAVDLLLRSAADATRLSGDETTPASALLTAVAKSHVQTTTERAAMCRSRLTWADSQNLDEARVMSWAPRARARSSDI